MGESVSKATPPAARPVGAVGTTLDRLASFRTVYLAIFAFVLLYLITVSGAEAIMDGYFRTEVAAAIRVDPADGPITSQIQRNVRRLVQRSPWTRIGGVSVKVFVLGADGNSLYVPGRRPFPPVEADPLRDLQEAISMLPATAEVVVSVPHSALLATSILVLYGTVLMTGLFFYNRAAARREDAILSTAVDARDEAATRAQSIERELGQVRERLSSVQPTERGEAEEIESLERERESLQRKLDAVTEREEELRAAAGRSLEFAQEIQALEDLLGEAVDDLGSKENEIRSLQDRLKRASKAAPTGGRARSSEQLGRRLRTLYRDLEIDDRAVNDMIALRDETMKLKAEEGLKRLADDTSNTAVRRKVGGLPAQVSIFEIGFAGKGRIYYTRGRQKRHRVVAIGAKNSQKTDLEYLSRLSPA
jgi:hypothetical protein